MTLATSASIVDGARSARTKRRVARDDGDARGRGLSSLARSLASVSVGSFVSAGRFGAARLGA